MCNWCKACITSGTFTLAVFHITFVNRKEFVAACVDHVFNKSVDGVFEQFRRGFFKVCNMDVVELFQPEELQSVVVGNENYNWDVFKQVSVAGGVCMPCVFSSGTSVKQACWGDWWLNCPWMWSWAVVSVSLCSTAQGALCLSLETNKCVKKMEGRD